MCEKMYAPIESAAECLKSHRIPVSRVRRMYIMYRKTNTTDSGTVARALTYFTDGEYITYVYYLRGKRTR